jgi:hypothetical protein
MHVTRYSDQDAGRWDELVARAPMATFLHTRRFLAYHGDRFEDRSVLLRDERGDVLGVFPAALDPADGRRVVSHPGVTFGGVIHAGDLTGDAMIETIACLQQHYREDGMHTLRYKAVPYIYQCRPSGDDL